MQHKELESLCLQQASELKEAKQEIIRLNHSLTAEQESSDFYRNRADYLQTQKPVTSKWLYFLYGALAGSAVTGSVIYVLVSLYGVSHGSNI
jgi:hypothetical protein